jgi:hypothetical protein
MNLFAIPQPGPLLEAFTQEIESLGGRVVDSLEHNDNLYVRSTLDYEREVRRGDKLRAGIAMRAGPEDIRVHPYVFRLVCSNGAILSQATQTKVISLDDPCCDPIVAVREAVRLCALPEAFEQSVLQARGAMEREADVMLLWLPLLARVSAQHFPSIFEMITRRLEEGRDRSRFGLMNAVTSTARDTRDPEIRWRLEELGAQVPALRERVPVKRESKRAIRAPNDSLVNV